MTLVGGRRDDITLPAWVRAIRAVALAKCVVSLAGFAVGLASGPAFPLALFLAHVVVFASAGLLLQVLGREDRRAVALGLFFLVLCGAWTDRPLGLLAGGDSVLSIPARLLRYTQVVAFAPYFFWVFIQDFPRSYRIYARRPAVRAAIWSTLAVGVWLLVANLSQLVLRPGSPAAGLLLHFDRGRLGTLFWPIVFGAAFPAIGFAVLQSRRADPSERRRVSLVIAAILLGIAPEMVMTLAASAFPALAAFVTSPRGRPLNAAIVYPPMLAMPFVIAYAVLVHHALDLRLIVRKALHYALARQTVTAIALAPVAAAGVLLYLRRDRTVAELVSGDTGLLLLAMAVAGVALAGSRRPLIAALDRRFFREQHDARRILSAVVHGGSLPRGRAELAAMVEAEVARGLQLRAARLLLVDRERGTLEAPDGSHRPIELESAVAQHLAGGEILEVTWDRPPPWLRDVPAAEKHWLVDAGARLLVPVLGQDGEMAGTLALGEKRSELPFSREDRELLATVAGSLALALRGQAATGGSGALDDQPAAECPGCGLLSLPGEARCGACAAPLGTAAVPVLLAGKFRAVERLGRGGMGIVYRAVDLALNRPVALKTLPPATAGETVQLRREARAMAAVSHPNLALILGAESWHGVPILIVEYLPGGTLEQRLERGALEPREALPIALALTGALERLHRSGLLHRDVKPSNIGFDAEGTPKLLDFGIAQVMSGGRVSAPGARWTSGPSGPVTAALQSVWRGDSEAGDAAGGMTGTLHYLSPEVVNGGPPDAALDLWALTMVLYECLAGRHPLAGEPQMRVLLRLAAAQLPDIRQLRPELPAEIARFFAEALHPNPRRRPGTARELASRLRRLEAGLSASAAAPAEELLHTVG